MIFKIIPGPAEIIKLWDGTTTVIIDSIVSALRIIDVEHAEIHAENHYTCGDYDDNVDTGTSKYWHLITPDTAARIHLTLKVKSSKNGLLEFFENPTTTDNGTSLTCFNSDRNSANTTTLAAYYDPTVSVDGTRIDPEVMGTDGAAPVGDSGGFSIRSNEIVLKQNEQYLVKYTTQTSDNRVSLRLEFYEE
jgi:hypothetical protein